MVLNCFLRERKILMGDKLQILFAMVGYMLIVILIGVFFAKRAQANSENYFLGGRSLGPWVAAMSAEASDMSGWLLMGLPGVAYWCGLADAAWTAIGLAVGTYINWLLVSKRLRSYSIVSGDAITVPDFLSNRYHEKKKVILGVSALFILVFFTVYAASCFVTCGKLFSGLFGYSYHSMMIAGAIFVLIYTAIGGFLAESASDFMQAVVMIIALVGVLVFGTAHAGGINAVIENAKGIPGYLSLVNLATPVTDANGVQQATGSVPLFGEASRYGFLTILSTASWGLGYFGMPQVLLRFMGIRKGSELKRSRRIAIVWVVISLTAAVICDIFKGGYGSKRVVKPFSACNACQHKIPVSTLKAYLYGKHSVRIVLFAGGTDYGDIRSIGDAALYAVHIPHQQVGGDVIFHAPVISAVRSDNKSVLCVGKASFSAACNNAYHLPISHSLIFFASSNISR